MVPNLVDDVVDFDVYRDFRRAQGKRLDKFIRNLKEDDDIDESYKAVLMCILNKYKNKEVELYADNRDDNGTYIDDTCPRFELSYDDDPRDSYGEFNVLDETDCQRTEFCKKRKDGEHNINCNGDEKKDPGYNHFLKHLKAHDKSYVLEYEKDGSTVVLKYEPTLQDIGTSRSKGLPVDMVPNFGRSFPCRDAKFKHYDHQRNEVYTESAVEGHGMIDINEEDDMILLKNKSSKKVAMGLNLYKNIKREDDRGNGCNVVNKRAYRASCKIEKKRKLNKVVSERVGVLDRIPDVENQCEHRCIRMPSALNKKSNVAGNLQKVKLEDDNFMDTPTLNAPKKRDHRKLILDIKQKVEPSNGHLLRSDGEIKNFKIGRSITVRKKFRETKIRQETRNETGSDVEILNGNACFDKGIASPFVPAKEFHDSEKCDLSAARIEFRRQVLDDLKRPYNKEEYTRHRKMVEAGFYFKFHPDLKRKLTKYRYKRGKLLTILRGFFFGLQHVTREGAFKPRKDRECLAVEPPRP